MIQPMFTGSNRADDHSATKLAFVLSLLVKLADFDRLYKAFNIM